MKHTQQKDHIAPLDKHKKRGFLRIALLAACTISSTTATAKDQHLLDILNEEAEDVGVVANTGKTTLNKQKPNTNSSPNKKPFNNYSINQSPANNSPASKPTADQPSFIMQVNSKLNPGAKKDEAPDDESKYLKQLEDEVQHYSVPTVRNSKSKANSSIDTKNTNNTGNVRSTQQSNAQQLNTEASIASQKNDLVQFTEAQRKQMEITLEMKIPGIYHLYKKLGLTEKQVVLKEFMENKKISTASKNILKLYSGD